MTEQDIPDIHLKVLYDFEYVTKDGRKIIIKEGEKLFLIKRTNTDWWQVIRNSAERPFYVPAAYVEEYSWSSKVRETIYLILNIITYPISIRLHFIYSH